MKKEDYIRSPAAIVALISELRGSGAITLASEDFETIKAAILATFDAPETDTWKPRVLWREEDPDESAKAFYRREYGSKPKAERPLLAELLAADERFYNAMKAVTANNKRRGRVGGKGEVETATSLRELFPWSPRRKPLPTPEEAVLYVIKRRSGERVRKAMGAGAPELELWRSVDDKETAAQYFERVIAPIQFAVRPTMKDLAAAQPALFRSLTNLCADQKRFDRVGFGEAGQAKAVSELLPVGAPRPPRRTKAADRKPT